MPEVFIEVEVHSDRQQVKELFLLNSGARGLELVVPKSLAKKLELRVLRRMKVYPIGGEIEGDVGMLEARIRNPETGEERRAMLEAVVLPDGILDCPLLGVVGQEKLGVAPNTVTGKAIFEPR